MKVLFVYPRFQRHAESHPELKQWVPLNEYLGSPSLGIAMVAGITPDDWEIEFRDDRLESAARPTDADLVAFSFFTPAATRAFELASIFRDMGKTVVAGGIFPTMMPEVCAEHFDAVVVGEGETVWPQLLEDFRAGTLKLRYQASCAADVRALPLPRVDLYLEQEQPGGVFSPDDYPVQTSRGCPMTCVACVLPTSMGRSLRAFPTEHILGQLEQLGAAGKKACLTEDTAWFPGATARAFETLLDRVAEEGGADISYVGVSMPQVLAATPRMLAKAKAAGVDMVYLVGGFDPVTKRAFTGEDPKMLARAHACIAKLDAAGIEPYTSFLLGNDDDDLGTVDRMLEFAAAAGIRKAEFALFTPYPGTPAWQNLRAAGRITDLQWNHYNDANVVFRPARMTSDELTEGYLRLWRDFYRGKEHLKSLSRDERTIQF
jgi:radical SAM superfamily enzyme YgiQ (UPF0313 family)